MSIWLLTNVYVCPYNLTSRSSRQFHSDQLTKEQRTHEAKQGENLDVAYSFRKKVRPRYTETLKFDPSAAACALDFFYFRYFKVSAAAV
jgi:inosine-uridine nucleoside N-ribohydrolase